MDLPSDCEQHSAMCPATALASRGGILGPLTLFFTFSFALALRSRVLVRARVPPSLDSSAKSDVISRRINWSTSGGG